MPFVPPWENVTPQDFLSAAEEGAQIGERTRSDKAGEALEYARLNAATANENANRGEQSAEDALAAKDNADKTAYSRGEQQKKDLLDQQDEQARIASDALKGQQGNIIQTPRGGIFTVNPLTGAVTQGRPEDALPPRPIGETQSDRIATQTLKGLQEQYAAALKEADAVDGTANPQSKSILTKRALGIRDQMDAIQKQAATPPPQATPTTPAPQGFIGGMGAGGQPTGANGFDPTATGFTMGTPNQNPLNAPAPAAPKDKVAIATQISQQHPDWTKQQVIDAVNGQ